jgi:ABC-type glycerol-3-phosphate transport system substrate-binding protein
MRFKKTAAVGAALAILAAGFGGAITSASGETATLRVWLNGSDTPDSVREYLVAEFNELHPDAELVIEEQQWTGLVERLTTALSSSDSPDVVEMGNTQAQAFEAAGALLDVTEYSEQLGGDDLLQSLLEAGTYDGRLYGVPYYAGARIMIYRTDLFEAAGVEVPTTIDEMIAASAALIEANADVPNLSGFYLPGRNWHAALSFIWDAGGDIAVQQDGQWVGQLSSPESIAGLETFLEVVETGNRAPVDTDDANDYLAFCAGEVGMMPAPGWKPGQIINPDDGCPDMEANMGFFAMPGSEAGTTAPVLLGGSNVAVSANSQNPDLAVDVLTIMASEEYQAQMAAANLIPARISQLEQVSGSPAAVAQAEAAANSRFTPTSEHWAGVEAANILPDMLVAIAQGGDIQAEAERADAAIEELLNQ